MSYQVLARKWRPRNFEQLVGQTHVARALIHALDGDRLHHACLFTGTRGVGKTTLARILAKCLNCESGVSSKPCGTCGACLEIDAGRFIDLLEIDAASRSKVDETRELMDNVQFTPNRGRYKVYLIDEVHMFSEKSFNALLKTLEEPPPHVIFLLATTDPQKLPITVLSRCLSFNLKRLPADDIGAHLERILTEETIDFEAAAVRLLAHAADGSMRDALSLLDQAIDHGAGQVAEEAVRAMLGTVDRSRITDLLDAIAAHDAAGALDVVDVLANDAPDYQDVLGELANTLHAIAVQQVVPEAADPNSESAATCTRLAARLSPEDVQLYYEIGLRGRRDLALAPDPKLGFEMTVLRMLAFTPETSAAPDPKSTAGKNPASGDPSPVAVPARDAGATAATTRPIVTPERAPIAGVTTATATTSIVAVEMPRAAMPPNPETTPTPAIIPAPAVTPCAEVKALNAELDLASMTSQSWRDLVGTLELSGFANALASNLSFVEANAHRLKLTLDPGHAQLAASPRPLEELQNTLAAQLGGPIKLDIAVDTSNNETRASELRNGETDRRQAAVRTITEDPKVRMLCETFDIRIDPDLVQLID